VSEDVTTARLADGERMQMVGEELGLTSFGLRQITLKPGQRNRIHRHREQEEAYVVLSGRLTIEHADGPQDLGPGDVARVAPSVRRRLVNNGSEPCVVIAVGAAGTHERGDGEAFLDWDDTEPKSPQDVPLPE
jgi:mannose-6-phosphate isomerase-like protein (cupin superfamily)